MMIATKYTHADNHTHCHFFLVTAEGCCEHSAQDAACRACGPGMWTGNYVLLCVCDSNLVVRRGKPEDVVAELIQQLGSISTVVFHEEVVKGQLSLVIIVILL